MNLDVEGHELNVLKTLNFEKISIKYICVEMIDHNEISIENNQKIKELLFANNFNFIKNFNYNYIYQRI